MEYTRFSTIFFCSSWTDLNPLLVSFFDYCPMFVDLPDFLIILFYWQIYFKKKKTGGISFNSTMPLTHVDEKLCYQILHEYKIHNAEVLGLNLHQTLSCLCTISSDGNNYL